MTNKILIILAFLCFSLTLVSIIYTHFIKVDNVIQFKPIKHSFINKQHTLDLMDVPLAWDPYNSTTEITKEIPLEIPEEIPKEIPKEIPIELPEEPPIKQTNDTEMIKETNNQIIINHNKLSDKQKKQYESSVYQVNQQKGSILFYVDDYGVCPNNNLQLNKDSVKEVFINMFTTFNFELSYKCMEWYGD